MAQFIHRNGSFVGKAICWPPSARQSHGQRTAWMVSICHTLRGGPRSSGSVAHRFRCRSHPAYSGPMLAPQLVCAPSPLWIRPGCGSLSVSAQGENPIGHCYEGAQETARRFPTSSVTANRLAPPMPDKRVRESPGNPNAGTRALRIMLFSIPPFCPATASYPCRLETRSLMGMSRSEPAPTSGPRPLAAEIMQP